MVKLHIFSAKGPNSSGVFFFVFCFKNATPLFAYCSMLLKVDGRCITERTFLNKKKFSFKLRNPIVFKFLQVSNSGTRFHIGVKRL